jgi:ATP synthase protein I
MNKMPASPVSDDELSDQSNEPVFKRWTADEARQLREKSPSVSPWRVVGWQVIAGVVIALGAWLLSGDSCVAMSAGYGALIVILPAAVLARGMTSRVTGMNAISAAMGFMVWEMVKIGLSVAMFLAAPQLIPGLNWLVMLIAVMLTMMVYGVAAVYKPTPKVVKNK